MTHPWPMFPPEANFYSLALGAGPSPSSAAAEAYAGHHAAIMATVGASSSIGAVAAEAHIGLGGTESATALMSHDGEHLVFADQTLVRSQLMNAAAAAHPTHLTQMVPAPPVHANRFEEAADEIINPMVWGALTPRIADLNLEYFGFMWPNNAAAGLRYGATLDALGSALMAPSMPAVSGGSIAAAAVAAASVAESAAMSGMQAAVGMVGSGASAVAGPAAALPATMSAVSSSGSSVATTPATAPVQSLGAVLQIAPPSYAQTQAPVQASTGMYAPSPNANLMTPPPVPPTQAPVQPITPRPPVAPPMSAAPGLTSFAKPAEPFSPPPPSGGKAVGLKPGMLNASALRGPVSAMPLATNAASTGLATATQPLAYVATSQPLPPVPPSLPAPPMANPGEIAHTFNPPSQSAPPTSPPTQPQATPHMQSGTNGSGPNSGAQMMGTGTNGAPQAPQFPLPQDPDPPPPPPPQRGRAPDGIHPPVDGPLTPGPPSKAREQRKGAEHLWDDQGGEWRYHGEDSSHNPHWDYKPPAAPGKTTEWDHIPINGLPPLKGGDAPSIISGLPPGLLDPAAPGTVGPPQNPLLTPYPGATMPPLPSAAAPPSDSGWFPDFHLPPIHLPDVTLPPLPNLGPTEIAGGGIGGILAFIGGCLVFG